MVALMVHALVASDLLWGGAGGATDCRFSQLG